MNRKVLIAATGLALVGLFFWSQQPRQAPVHEDATSAASASISAEREALETPPPLALPDKDTTIARGPSATNASAYPDFLPKEAITTLRLIERGGPYPYRQDDGVFQNRERRLPRQARGYYREYTVKTPGSRDRGARRIVAGGQPPTEFFYTDDHYGSFRRFTLSGSAADDVAGRSR
jgi:ribonuclease T1